MPWSSTRRILATTAWSIPTTRPMSTKGGVTVDGRSCRHGSFTCASSRFGDYQGVSASGQAMKRGSVNAALLGVRVGKLPKSGQ